MATQSLPLTPALGCSNSASEEHPDDSLEDIAAVMNDSSVVNFAQLVGTSGEILVQSYDWTGFFSKMLRKIDGIKQYHHFSFEEEILREGKLIVQKSCSDVPSRIKFLKDAQCVFPDILPEVVQPRGLRAERQWYLYEKIREFCLGASKDKTCPLPSVPKLVTRLCLSRTCLK